jgi:integrase
MASYTKRNGKWHVRIRRKGYPTQCGVFDTKREAEDWAGGVESQMAKRLHIVDKRSHLLTLGQVVEAYIAEVIDRYKDKPRSEKRLKGHQPRYEALFWGRQDLAARIIGSISPDDIAAWMDDRLEDMVNVYKRDRAGRIIRKRGRPLPGKPRQIAKKTVLNELTRLSAIFTWARTEYKMPALVNPIALIPKNKRPKGRERDRRLEPGELRRLVKAAEQDELPLIGPIIEFAVETACRRREITRIRLRDYDRRMRSLKLRDTKNGEDRVIGLSSKARAILDRIIEDRGLIDPDERFFPVTPNEVTWAFRRCCRVTEIDGQYVEPIGDRLDPNGLTFHDLRHEGTSRYVEKGLSIPEVASQTGHKTYQSLMRYTHMEARKISDKLDGAPTGGDD